MKENVLGNPREKCSGFPQFVEECKRVKLSEICSKGKSSLRQKDIVNDGPYSVYGASGIIGTMNQYQNEIPYVAVVKDGAGVGRANACEPKTSVLGTMQALLPNSNVERDYLLYLVRSLRLGDGFSGSTIPHIYFKDYGKIEVPLPSIDVQKRIISRLGSVEAQIAQTEAQIEQLDSLVKSRFIEMFGDVSTNPHEYKKSHLKDIAKGKLSYGSTCPAIQYDGETRYLRITDIAEDGSLNNDFKSPSEINTKHLLSDGDILFARSGATVGKTYRYREVDGRAIYAGYLIRLVPDTTEVLPDYVFWYTKTDYYKSFVSNAQRVVAQPNINAKEYGALEILVPPLTLQQEFADFVSQVDKLRFATQQQIDKLEMLKKSLMQEYFG